MKFHLFNQFFRKFFSDTYIDERIVQLDTVDNPIRHVRAQTADMLLRIIALLATITLLITPILNGYSPSESILSGYEIEPILIGYAIPILLMWVVTLSKQFSYRFRISFLLLVMYFIGTYNLLTVGLADDSRVFLFMFIITTTILAGSKAGLFAIFLSAASMLGIGLSQLYGWLDTSQFVYGIDDLQTRIVISLTLNFIMSTTITTIPVIVIMRSLNQMFNRMKMMRQAQEETNQELQDTSQALEKALNAQERLNNIQTTVIRTVSHEFRTPLSVITVSADLLKKHRDKFDEAREEQYLEQIGLSAHHLAQMLSNVVSVDSIQDDLAQLSRQLISSKRLIGTWDAMLNDTRKLNNNQEIRFTIVQQSEEPLYIDLYFINQLFQTLVENAVRYNEQEKEIIITYQWDGVTLRWTIVDEGIGIPSTDLEHVFQPFYRSDNAVNIPGVGLGLYRAQSIVSAMEGSILLENRPGKSGTIATIEIPASK